MNNYYFTLCVFAILVYFVWSDPNGPRWLDLQFRMMGVEIRRWILKQKLKRGMDSDMRKMIRELEKRKKNDKNQM